MQAWRVGDERAVTYLWLLTEAMLRQAGGQLRALDAAAGTDVWSDPGMAPFTTAESAQWKVGRTAQILVAAGVLDEVRLGSDLHAAIYARSRLLLNWDRRRGMLHRTMFAPSSRPPPSGPASQAMRVTPIGRVLRVASDRAPSALHLMSLVRTETEAVITVVVMRQKTAPDNVTDWPGNNWRTLIDVDGIGRANVPSYFGIVRQDPSP